MAKACYDIELLHQGFRENYTRLGMRCMTEGAAKKYAKRHFCGPERAYLKGVYIVEKHTGRTVLVCNKRKK